MGESILGAGEGRSKNSSGGEAEVDSTPKNRAGLFACSIVFFVTTCSPPSRRHV